jgi:hypothetical protein
METGKEEIFLGAMVPRKPANCLIEVKHFLS